MNKKNRKWLIGSVASAALYLFLEATFFEKYFFTTKTFDIGNTGKKDRIRILLLTDLHFRESLWPYHYKLAHKINDLQPDMILITGDTLDRTGKICPMDKFFSLLGCDIPKVAIPGNHDYKAKASIELIEAIYRKYNCQLLINQTNAFEIKGRRIVVTGLDDFIESESCLRDAVKNTGREDHHFLLIHSPLQQEQAKKEIDAINSSRKPAQRLNISYIFAGHNHGGQVRLPGYVPVLPVKAGNYIDGWYNTEAPFLYVSRGFGTSTVPFRFGARAEITLFNYFV